MKYSCAVVLFFCLYILNSAKGQEEEEDCTESEEKMMVKTREMLENDQIDETCKEYLEAIAIHETEAEMWSKVGAALAKFKVLPKPQREAIEQCLRNTFAEVIDQMPEEDKPSETCVQKLEDECPFRNPK